MEKIYSVRNLDCAHCAGKIEEEISKHEAVKAAVLVFPTRKLKVRGDISLEALNEIAGKVETGVQIVKQEKTDDGDIRNDIIVLLVGAALFIAALICSDISALSLVLYIAAYILLGRGIIAATFRNILKGNIFDENFLMTIATVGAFILGKYSEAVGVVLFFTIGEIFEKYAVNKSRKAITAAAGLKVERAEILADGEFRLLNSDEIQKGSIIRVKAGERIACDGIIIEGESRIDTSAVNGEPVPVSVRKGDSVISGCINLNGVILVEASSPASESTINKITEAIENAVASKPKIDRFISRFARVYTPFVLVCALITAVVPSLITGMWSKWIYTALTFLVISCPCALVLSVPLAYFSGIGAASKMGILFKSGVSLEALSGIKAVVFDKTGTVTTGTFDVTGVESYGGYSDNEVLSMCASAEQGSTHPAGISIIAYCDRNAIAYDCAESIKEYSGRGISARKDGVEILCGNRLLMEENEISIPCEDVKTTGTVVYVSKGGELCGRIIVSDKIRETSASAVSQLKKMGLYTAMLTGDKSDNARLTARETGIEYSKGELLPADKLSEMNEIRREHGGVMFIGDGINDGPVLAGADVGAAMMNGSDLAVEAADIIFMRKELDCAVKAKKIADRTLRISRQNIVFALAFKAAVLILGAAGFASMWFAVFADSGVAMLSILNSMRGLSTKRI